MIDQTFIELFLPRQQNVLDGKLAFCKQQAPLVNHSSQALLAKVVTPSPALEDALYALKKAELIKRDNRVITVHRVVQEAMNFQDAQDLQASFSAVVEILNEAFPKRQHGKALYDQWGIASLYIHDAVHLAGKFSEHTRPPLEPRLFG